MGRFWGDLSVPPPRGRPPPPKEDIPSVPFF